MKFFPRFEKGNNVLGVRLKDLEEFFDLYNKNNISYFHLKMGDFSITIEDIEGLIEKNKRDIRLKEIDKADFSSTEENQQETNQYFEIKAPITGTFYRSPSPDSKPFVKIGDKVDENTVVCIIESMKVMNEIKAGVKGKIIKIPFENESKIKKGDIIFYVEKEL